MQSAARIDKEVHAQSQSLRSKRVTINECVIQCNFLDASFCELERHAA
jgi:hypothetical protein